MGKRKKRGLSDVPNIDLTGAEIVETDGQKRFVLPDGREFTVSHEGGSVYLDRGEEVYRLDSRALSESETHPVTGKKMVNVTGDRVIPPGAREMAKRCHNDIASLISKYGGQESNRENGAFHMFTRAFKRAKVLYLPSEPVCRAYMGVEVNYAVTQGVRYTPLADAMILKNAHHSTVLEGFRRIPILPDGGFDSPLHPFLDDSHKLHPDRKIIGGWQARKAAAGVNWKHPAAPFSQMLIVWDRPIGLAPHTAARSLRAVVADDKSELSEKVNEVTGSVLRPNASLSTAGVWTCSLVDLDQGLCLDLIRIAGIESIANDDLLSLISRTRTGGVWNSSVPYSAPDWWNIVFGMLSEYRSITTEDDLFGKVNRRRRGGKRWRNLPSRFYEVRFRHTVKKARPSMPQEEDPVSRKPQAHRSDVRHHERVRVRRGTLPMDEKLQEKLRARKYRVYTDGMTLTDKDSERLMDRHGRIPKYRPGEEWIAVLSYTVVEHIRGPEDAPYIPSVRTAPDMDL